MSKIVSIITPSFNRANIIHETAESIFRQTNTNWEWVIVDDGSTDDSWEVINKYAAKDSRVKVFKRDREPKGACTCRNIAVSKATGEFLIFLDTDDLLASFCIEQRFEAFKSNPTMDFIIFRMLMFKQKPDDLKLLWNVDSKVNDVERILIGDSICQGTGTIWRKSSFVKIGLWDERLNLWQDIQLHLKSLLSGLKYGKRMDLRPDIFIRISEISLSRTGFHSPKKLESRYIVFEETALKLFSKNEIEKHQIGLKEMFVSIFTNSLKIHSFYLSKQILRTVEKVNLLSKFEVIRLYLFIYLFKFRMNKISIINNFILNNLGRFRFHGEVFLNKVIYNENIDL